MVVVMISESIVKNPEREAICDILMAILQRWQDQLQPAVGDIAEEASLFATSCGDDSDVCSDDLVDNLAATMILQRPEFATPVVDLVTNGELPVGMDETVILSSSGTVAPMLVPAATKADSVSIFASVAGVSEKPPVDFDLQGADDPLAKTQILSRFSGGVTEPPMVPVPENDITNDDSFAATVILNPAVGGSPQSSPAYNPPEVVADAADLAKTCILQPFTGTVNNPTPVTNTVVPIEDNNGSPDSLLATVIMPPKPERTS